MPPTTLATQPALFTARPYKVEALHLTDDGDCYDAWDTCARFLGLDSNATSGITVRMRRPFREEWAFPEGYVVVEILVPGTGEVLATGRIGDWIVKLPDGSFTVYTDTEFTERHSDAVAWIDSREIAACSLNFRQRAHDAKRASQEAADAEPIRIVGSAVAGGHHVAFNAAADDLDVLLLPGMPA